MTMVEWTKFLPESERLAFVSDVLDRYRTAASNQPSEENTFKFYQMDVTHSRGSSTPETTRAGCR